MTHETNSDSRPTRKRIVVVGGVAGGMSAAARARRLDEHASIDVLEQSEYVSFANCGLPYHLSGEIPDREQLLLHDRASLAASLDLDVRTGSRVTAVDRAAREVTVETADGTYRLPYDALLLAPGAVAVRPPIDGLDHPSVHALRTVPDVDALRGTVDTLLAERGDGETAPAAVVVGAGFIGLEAVEALASRGLTVHLVELADHVLPPIDAELAPLLAEELTSHGVRLHLGVSAQEVTSAGSGVTVTLSDGTVVPADLVVVNVGVRPASALAKEAGLRPERAARSPSTLTTAPPTPTSGPWATPSRSPRPSPAPSRRSRSPARPTGRAAAPRTRSAAAAPRRRHRSWARRSCVSSASPPPSPERARLRCDERASPTRWCTCTPATTPATSRAPSRSTSWRASPRTGRSWARRRWDGPVWTSASTSWPPHSAPA